MNCDKAKKRLTLFYILFIYFISILLISGCGEDEKTRTLTPQESAAIDAVQSQDTIGSSDRHGSIGVAFVSIESEGHRMSVDSCYAGTYDGFISVKFYFFIDGSREFAEWRVKPDGRITPANEWAYIFMGQ